MKDCELHHCYQREEPPVQMKKDMSKVIILAVSSGYSYRGVVWCVATEGGEKNAENTERFLLRESHTGRTRDDPRIGTQTGNNQGHQM